MSIGFPLVVSVLDANRFYSPDMLKGTHRLWRVHIAFALVKATW